MSKPYRLAWSMIGRSMVFGPDGREAVRPPTAPGSLNWYRDQEEWERIAPIIVDALNAAAEKAEETSHAVA